MLFIACCYNCTNLERPLKLVTAFLHNKTRRVAIRAAQSDNSLAVEPLRGRFNLTRKLFRQVIFSIFWKSVGMTMTTQRQGGLFLALSLCILIRSCHSLQGPQVTPLSFPPTTLSSINNALFTQVVSDVDDTLKSSGGVNVGGVALGGIDVQYERGEVYPGVAQFYLELSLGRRQQSSSSSSSPPTPPKVAVLTARAEEFKGALKLKETSAVAVALREAAEASGISNWGLGPVLYGSVAEWIIQNKKGLRKFSNFERLLEQDPTGTILQYVYVGDTGELDQEAGETMLREYPEVVKAVFLHVVSGDKDGPDFFPPSRLINGRPVIFFRTYVGAATAAMQLGFFGVDGLERVINAARKKLENVPKTDDKWQDLEKDIQTANRVVFGS